ncbi:transposable element Tcb1 transposase [Trichonephila clavipes]|nr:transposable element Tcb1 transposase [Trichonephila clavipes]
MAVTDHSVTSRAVARHIEFVMHHSVSARTIRPRLQQSGLSARHPLLALPLMQNHRRLRRQWCDERRIYHSCTPLVRIAGTLISQRYISEVLEPVVLYDLQGFTTFIFQQDNITSAAATPDQLRQRGEASLSDVPQEHIQSLFESMPRREAAVISNNGGY